MDTKAVDNKKRKSSASTAAYSSKNQKKEAKEVNDPQRTVSPETQEKPKSNHFKRNAFFYGAIIILLITIVLQHFFNLKRVEDLEARMALEQTQIIAAANERIEINNKESLTFAMMSLVWAVRSEMLKENYELVNQYILQLLKQENISSVVIADASGMVMYSSNKKMEGLPFSQYEDVEYLEISEVEIKKISLDELHLIAPVMSFSNRIGTLFINYKPLVIPENFNYN